MKEIVNHKIDACALLSDSRAGDLQKSDHRRTAPTAGAARQQTLYYSETSF